MKSLIILLQINCIVTISLYNNEKNDTNSHSILAKLFNKKLIDYKNVLLNSNTIKQVNTGDKIIIECPLPDNLNRESHHSRKKAAPIFITTWYKNQIKISQFIDEYFDRVKFFERKFKIKYLIQSDSGVYSCEVIMGTGISSRSYNLTLQVIDNQETVNEDHESTKEEIEDEEIITNDEYQQSDNNNNNQIDQTHIDQYVRGERPVFDQDDNEIITSFEQLEKTQVQFDCSSRGIPPPQITWLKNGRIISEEEYGLIRNVMKLNLKQLSILDSGVYVCQVSNQFGKLNRTFNLKVLEKIKILTNEPLNITAKLNQQVVLKCQLELSLFETNFKWFIRYDEYYQNIQFDWSLISNKTSPIYYNDETYYPLDLSKKINNKLSFLLSKSLNPDEYNQLDDGSLIINKINLKHVGYYLCLVNNSRGFNYKRIFVNLEQKLNYDIKDNKDNNLQYNLYSSVIDNQAISQLNFKPSKSADKNGHFISTPIMVIISISTFSIVLIAFLLCFYKNL